MESTRVTIGRITHVTVSAVLSNLRPINHPAVAQQSKLTARRVSLFISPSGSPVHIYFAKDRPRKIHSPPHSVTDWLYYPDIYTHMTFYLNQIFSFVASTRSLSPTFFRFISPALDPLSFPADVPSHTYTYTIVRRSGQKERRKRVERRSKKKQSRRSEPLYRARRRRRSGPSFRLSDAEGRG